MTMHSSAALAKPATFDGSDRVRRAMLGKVHVAKRQLALDEDDYRQILFEETGQSSSGSCSHQQLEQVLNRFRALGWQDLPRAGKPRAAQHPAAKKARALWISLHQLGAVRSPEERALEAFAKRQLKCERMVWADQREAFKLIEALKAMAQRHGWVQTDISGNNLALIKLAEGLCEAIRAKLVAAGEVPDHWTLNDAAFRLCGIELGRNGGMTVEGYRNLAAALGKELRAAGGGA